MAHYKAFTSMVDASLGQQSRGYIACLGHCHSLHSVIWVPILAEEKLRGKKKNGQPNQTFPKGNSSNPPRKQGCIMHPFVQEVHSVQDPVTNLAIIPWVIVRV